MQDNTLVQLQQAEKTIELAQTKVLQELTQGNYENLEALNQTLGLAMQIQDTIKAQLNFNNQQPQ